MTQPEVQHGTPEGFRLHKRWEGEPCPACKAAMEGLLAAVRALQASVRGSLGPVAPAMPFSAYQRTKWPERRAAERAAELAEHPPLPPLPPVVLAAEPCVGLESWMPSAPRTNLKNFRSAGWQARLTRAAGPRIAANGVVPAGKEVVYTVCLAAQKEQQRVIMTWQFTGEKWVLDDILHNRLGVIKSNKLKEIL
jgi:hypothetical protein